MNARLKSILKRPFFLIAIAFLALVHGGFTYLQVPIITSVEYSRNAFDLSVTTKWRYGYVVEHHGAFLAKTRNIPETVPYPDPGLSEDKGLASAMSHKLEGYSSPYPGLITGLSGETITYRPLLESASIIPMIVVEATGLGRCLPEMTAGLFVWISGVLFYCTAAFLVWGTVCLIDALVAKHSDRQN